MTHGNKSRGDASPSVLGMPLALVKACQELYSGQVESGDKMVADTLGELSDCDGDGMALLLREGVFAALNPSSISARSPGITRCTMQKERAILLLSCSYWL